MAQQGADRAVDVADRCVDRDRTAVLQGTLSELDQCLVERKLEAVVLFFPLVTPRSRAISGRWRIGERSSPSAFQWSTASVVSSISTWPMASSSVWNPSSARSSRTSSAMYSKKFSTNSGSPENLARSSGFGWRHRPGRCRVAHPHHHAAHDDEWCGREAEFLRAEERSDHDVSAGLELAVGMHYDSIPQVVEQEGLLGLRQSEFPRCAGVFDGGLG